MDIKQISHTASIWVSMPMWDHLSYMLSIELRYEKPQNVRKVSYYLHLPRLPCWTPRLYGIHDCHIVSFCVGQGP